MPEANNEPEDMEGRLQELIEELAEGPVPVLEVILGLNELTYKEGDYRGFVDHFRATIALLRDQRIASRLHENLNDEIIKISGGKHTPDNIKDGIRRKDGFRLMSKLSGMQQKHFVEGQSLLSGSTFDECFLQYRALTDHVESLWDDACDLYRRAHFPHSTFVSILVIEEIGKLSTVWLDLLRYGHQSENADNGVDMVSRDHRKKHFLGVISGAVINARLDRILGVKKIKQLLQDVESGKLERLRQSCLYIDKVEGKIIVPKDVIDQDTAKFFVTLSGELWAEILGHFPWDFFRMIEKVIDFEIENGFPVDQVKRDQSFSS